MCTLHQFHSQVTLFVHTQVNVYDCSLKFLCVTFCTQSHRCLVPHQRRLVAQSQRGNICLFWNNDSNQFMYNCTPRNKTELYYAVFLLHIAFIVTYSFSVCLTKWTQIRKYCTTVLALTIKCRKMFLQISGTMNPALCTSRLFKYVFLLKQVKQYFLIDTTVAPRTSFSSPTKDSECPCL